MSSAAAVVLSWHVTASQRPHPQSGLPKVQGHVVWILIPFRLTEAFQGSPAGRLLA
ncbi:hypothetical protein GGTG_13645 [Gaeumannomyces tritici R3-111a-1]|uniref:Uncharacterized protein n=1 Tax=Gaeumannomyces tritici (strain R3-111a-1) TaxID=644352 RepID=J3PJG3_GAET3|nr:hypothetical protein GGTG_13645 [Gaeumannomyces tritici R3-111a-1]EJT68781.1 hypothetical protein GGTG_13645 [Gaeumannomyces tritici R3-111a-1]